MNPALTDMNDFAHNLIKACEDMNAMMSSYLGAATRSSAASWQGLEDLAKNVGGFMNESLARSVSASKTIMSAKTPQEAADTHAEFLKDCFDGMVAGGGKLSEISLRAAKSAMEPLSQHTNEAMGAMMKKAKIAC